MNLSQQIAQALLLMLRDGEAEICRNDLATQLGCSPSQINYVLTSRFRPEMGYSVESRRGGGGYVRIRRISVPVGSKAEYLLSLLSQLPEATDETSANRFLRALLQQKLISNEEAALAKAALSDQALRLLPQTERNTVRVSILRSILPVLAAAQKEY